MKGMGGRRNGQQTCLLRIHLLVHTLTISRPDHILCHHALSHLGLDLAVFSRACVSIMASLLVIVEFGLQDEFSLANIAPESRRRRVRVFTLLVVQKPRLLTESRFA